MRSGAPLGVPLVLQSAALYERHGFGKVGTIQVGSSRSPVLIIFLPVAHSPNAYPLPLSGKKSF
jgi:hypothetical protein